MNKRFQDLSSALRSFPLRQRLFIYALIILGLISFLVFLWLLNGRYLVEIPAKGGSLTEGIIGSPRFVNPLLALTDADRDLTALVYSGLTRAVDQGEIIPDLAEHFAVENDGLTYTFTLRPNLTWHDGAPLTAADVIFTITKAQDPILKSPRRAIWEGVKAEKIDERTVKLTLKQPYSAFLENTAMGILPEHLWKGVEVANFAGSDLNINPIGSGPYQVKGFVRDASGAITSYHFLAFRNFALGEPKVSQLKIRFYEGETNLLKDLSQGTVDSAGPISPEGAEFLAPNPQVVINHAPLPRIFGIFFNPNQAQIFAYKEVREALNRSLDREQIIREGLRGYAQPLAGPLPPGSLGFVNEPIATSSLAAAQALLESKGWATTTGGIYEKKVAKKETLRLSFTIATSDAPELKAVAGAIAARWRELGAEVSVKVFEKGDLAQDIIRPRKYDAVFFGEVIGRNPDPYAFWHSSQRFDPGLNIALYTNATVDKLLEDMRLTTNTTERLAKYETFVKAIQADTPAVFVYTPYFLYLTPKTLRQVNLIPIAVAAERFNTIYQWYLKTEKVWPIFARDSNH